MTLFFALLLVVWGNVVNALVRPALPGGDWAAVAWGLALLAVAAAFARERRLSAADLGLTGHGAARAAATGGGLGVAVALVGVLVLRFPPLLGAPVSYLPLAAVDGRTFAMHLVFFLPLAAVLPEELAFRGALFGALLKRRGAGAAVVWSSVPFALWHLVVLYATLRETSVAGTAFFWLAWAAALVVAFAGGVAFALLRLRSGTLAASLAAHWSFNAVVLVGLRA